MPVLANSSISQDAYQKSRKTYVSDLKGHTTGWPLSASVPILLIP